MAYIGKTPVLGNFVKLDAISVVNGQAAYTMQNGGVNFTSYDNVNQFLVSLNGILQSPTDSFTVSGSTLTFASNLSTGDVIDFVMVLGNTLDVGTPSDNTVTTAKLADSSVSLAKLTATGTKDATTFLRGDNTFAEAGGGKINQIVQVVTNTSHYISTTTSYTDINGMTLNITPSATSSKILVMVCLHGDGDGADRGYQLKIIRDTTDIFTDGSKKSVYGNQRIAGRNATMYLDSPNTTSQITYKCAAQTDNGGYYFQNFSSYSMITLMEVLA
jgi:hypothetical protein